MADITFEQYEREFKLGKKYQASSDILVSTKKKKTGLIRHLRTVNIEYQKIKKSFLKANDTKNKKDFQKAYDNYLKYHTTCYNGDVDAVLEFSELCSKLASGPEDELYQDAIGLLLLAQKLKSGNALFHIKIGENLAKSRRWHQALDVYEELYYQDLHKGEKNKVYLLNCAILAAKIENKKKQKKYTEEFIKNYNEKNSDIKNGLLLKRAYEDLDKDAKPLNIPLTITKGKGGAALISEQRLGVLLILSLFPVATGNQLKEKWLINNDTTHAMINDLILSRMIVATKLIDGTEVFVATDLGRSYSFEWMNAIMEWENGGKKFEFNAVITNKLAEKFLEWRKTAKVWTITLSEKDKDGIEHRTWLIDHDLERLLKFEKEIGGETLKIMINKGSEPGTWTDLNQFKRQTPSPEPENRYE